VPEVDHAAFVRDLSQSVGSLVVLVEVAQRDINRLFDEYGASQSDVYAAAAIRAIEHLGPCYRTGVLSFATIAPLSDEEGRARIAARLPSWVHVDVGGTQYEAAVPWRIASAVYDGRPLAEFDRALWEQLGLVPRADGDLPVARTSDDADDTRSAARREADALTDLGDFDQRPMVATATTSDIDDLAAQAEALSETEVRAIAAAWEFFQRDKEHTHLVGLGITLAYARSACGPAADAIEAAVRASVNPWRGSLDDVPTVEQQAVEASRTHAIAVMSAGLLPASSTAVLSQAWREGLREANSRP
jgi:hypothetical protein